MDSPEPSKSPISSSSAAAATSSPVQESPFSNYISSLSPIKHDKASHVTQAFAGLNSPPLVFTSPLINTLRRPQSSHMEVSQNGEGDKKNTTAPGSLEKSVTILQQGLITDIKEYDTNDLLVQPSSSSERVDEYLADPVEADCTNSSYSVNLKLKQSNNALQSSVNGLLGSKNLKFGHKNDVGSDVDANQLFSGLSEEGLERKVTFDFKPLKIENEQHAGLWISEESLKIVPDVFDLSSQEKERKNLDPEKVVEDHGDGCDGFLQLQPESLQSIQAYEDFAKNVEGDVDVPVHNMILDLEASEHQCGLSRRCLKFGKAQARPTASRNNFPNLANDVISSTSLATTSETNGLGSSHVDLSVTSRKRQLVNLSQLAINMIPQCYGEKSSTVSKPSGIGLHLNSVVNAIPMARDGTTSMKLAIDCMGIQGIKSAPISSCQPLENMQSCADSFEKVSAAPQGGTHEPKVCIIVGSAASESLCTMESVECHTTLYTKRKLSSEDGDSKEVLNQQSPKKKRKKSSNGTDGEGCKRCNCKKTKCLKLYCDCFVAGIYCDEPCSCQGCFNRPEYEDTVLETRQLIESRNPLAFAPKIVQPFSDFPEYGNLKTPSSARHKRGCNCKRSMCLKKYCECYQANVGCSVGCRCEGCKNVYGKKEDYCLTEEMENRGGGEIPESTVAAKNDFLHSELCDPHHLTPLTPSFQCSNHGKNAPISRLLSRTCLPSPESDLTILSYAKSTRSPRTCDNSNDMLLETSKENLDVGSYFEGINYNNADVLSDECHHTPLPDHPSNVIGSSSSSKARELTSYSRFQLGPRSGCISSGGSLRWCSSPITPISALDGTKELQELDSDAGLYDILEDDTSELLKDANTPINSVKASSPNSKRVSPPHNLHQLGSSSSGPLRTGRKFILKAVPSFPPLTPCIDLKGRSNQSISNFQKNSSNE